jgi:hypothetical protein
VYALPYLVFARLHRAAIDARRNDRTWRFVAWSVIAGLIAALLVAVAVVLALLLVDRGWWPLALAVVALFVVPPLHAPLVRHVWVPLGWVRAAYWTGRLSGGRDPEAYALCAAAWAFSHDPDPRTEAWLLARRDRRVPLGDAEIVVTALIASARGDGDAETARLLMRSLAHIVEVHPAVRELAGEWLACDAVERGAWAELAADATAARWPATALSLLLEGIALRRTGAASAPSAAELTARWLLAPHRRATRRLIEAPVAPRTPASPTVEPADIARLALPHAVAAQCQLAGTGPTAASLAATVHAWDAALADGATRTWLATRAIELDAPLGAVDRALRDVVAAVTDELARMADAAALPAPTAHGPVGDALARRLRHGRLDALEAGFTRWAERRAGGRRAGDRDASARASIDEWREWVALRAQYDAAVAAGGPELRRLAFPHAYVKGTNMAAWLWNARKEYALSHAVSKWLLQEAMAVGDTEAIDVCTRNVRLAVHTRMGPIQG